jgi:ribosomal protein L37AE/L43A
MAECKPDRRVKRQGGEVWACQCGTMGVTFNGVTVRYSPKDFKRLLRLMRIAEAELLGEPTAVPAAQADGTGNLVH